jgi:hypothetical protein
MPTSDKADDGNGGNDGAFTTSRRRFVLGTAATGVVAGVGGTAFAKSHGETETPGAETETPASETETPTADGGGPDADGMLRASLRGAAQVPPVRSDATGVATLTPTDAGLAYRLVVKHVDGVTQAHIHEGADDQNGPVVAPLLQFTESVDGSGSGTPQSTEGDCYVVATGTVEDASLVDAILSNPSGYYVNVHTVGHPAGEIRGQLTDDAAVPFTVRVENVSADDALTPSAGDPQSVPLSPGAYAVHDSLAPLFTPGLPDRGEGLEALAEDGDPSALAPSLDGAAGVAESGTFAVPAGGTDPSPAGPGDVYEFSVTAEPGQRLSFATMFVASNDLFFAPDETGTALFDDAGVPVTGDVTESVLLWDAGTEVNEEPGVGPNQAPLQSGPDTGPAEAVPVAPVAASGDGYDYPDADEVVRVTVTPAGEAGDVPPATETPAPETEKPSVETEMPSVETETEMPSVETETEMPATETSASETEMPGS